MKLNRGSLYGAFGDKQSLFREVMLNYADRVSDLVSDTLGTIKDPLKSIEAFFHQALLNDIAVSKKGCLLFNTISELRNINPELASEAANFIEPVRTLLEKRLLEAQVSNLIPKDKCTQAMSNYLITLMAGLRVQSKSGKSREEIKSILDLGMQSLTC